MGRPVFWCRSLAADVIRLDGPEGHHAAVVRRLAVGEPVRLVDGAGGVAEGVVAAVGKRTLDVTVASRTSTARPAPRLTVVQAVPKGARAELTVQVLTEVGVDRVVPWAAERSQVRVTAERGERLVDKWRAWAHEAGKQSRRAWFCEVAGVATTADLAVLLTAAGCAVVLHEQASEPMSVPPDAADVVLVVGPEGGITDEEIATLTAASARLARLGDTVLRTSTAGAVAAGIVLGASRWR